MNKKLLTALFSALIFNSVSFAFTVQYKDAVFGDMMVYGPKEGDKFSYEVKKENNKFEIYYKNNKLPFDKKVDDAYAQPECAIVSLNSKVGIYTNKGLILPMQYDDVFFVYPSHDIHAVKKGEKVAVFSVEKGEFLTSFDYDDVLLAGDVLIAHGDEKTDLFYKGKKISTINGDCFVYRFGDNYGVQKKDKFEIFYNGTKLPGVYDEVSEASHGIVYIKKDGRYGLAHHDKVIIDTKFDDIYTLDVYGSTDVYYVLQNKDNKHKIIMNANLKEGLIEGDFDNVKLLKNDYLVLGNNGKNRLLYKSKEISTKEYDEIISHKNYAILKDGSKYDLLYKTAKFTDEQFDKVVGVKSYIDGDFIAAKKGNELRIYKDSKLYFSGDYDEAEILTHNEVKVKKNSNAGVVALNGKIKVDLKYDDVGIGYIEYDSDYTPVYYDYIVKKGSKFGVVQENKLIIPCVYDEIKDTHFGYLLEAGNKQGLSDENGNILVPVEFDDCIYVNDDYYITKKNDKYGLYGHGKAVLGTKYDKIQEVKKEDGSYVYAIKGKKTEKIKLQ